MADEVLTLGIQVEVEKALKGMTSFERQMKAKMTNITKAIGKMGGVNARMLEQAIELSEDWMDETDKLRLSHQAEYKALVEKGIQIEDLESKIENMSGAEKAAAKESLKNLKDQGKEQQKLLTKYLGQKGGRFPRMAKGISEALKGGIEAASPALTSLFGKDLKGTLENTLGFAGTVLSKSLKAGAGAGLKLGAGLKDRGAARGGAAGAAMKAGGAVAGKMGGALQMIGKLGPLISGLSTVFMAVVKLLIDAEAQAKAFNKEILASASTAEFLADAGGNASVAFDDLDSTMSKIRDSAYSLNNIKWGISADEHKSVLNVLTQEGVSLKNIKQQADVAGMSVGKFAGELVHMSVAYSRSLGVPLQEINQLQSEMMTEMGANLDSTKMAFSHMTLAATDSGIAANKFYATIRSVSSDLSLYNTRMEQAVKTLKLLGKVMNPRDAAKFMQTVTGAMKNMGQDDRMRLGILAGAKGDKIIQQDLKQKRDNLYKDIAGAIGEADEAGIANVKKRMEGGKGSAADVWDEVRRKAKGQAGTLKGSESELKYSEKAAKKGAYGKGVAMENLGMGASVDMMKAAITSLGGGSGSLMDSAGDIGVTKLAEMAGVNTTQLRGYMQLEMAVNEQKEELLAQGKISQEQIDRGEITTQSILDTMSEEEQEALKDNTKTTEDFAKEQSELTSSALDKLSTLVDFIMSQLYNLLKDTWGVVWDMLGGTDALVSLMNYLVEITAANPAIAAAIKAGIVGPISILADIGKKKSGRDKGEQEDKRQREREIREDVSKSKDKFKREALEKATKGGQLDEDKYNKLIKDKDTAREKDASSAILGNVFDELSSVRSVDDAFSSVRNISDIDTRAVRSASGVDVDTKDSKALIDTLDIVNRGLPTNSGAVDLVEDSANFAEDTKKSLSELVKHAIGNKNSLYVRFGKGFLGGEYQTTMETAVLNSMRTALWEFYLYSEEEDRGALLASMEKAGLSPKDMPGQLNESGKAIGPFMKDLPARASGGIVTGITNGLANVRAAAGEGLTSIGKGETIVPRGGSAGGGGGKIEISVKSGFEQFIEAKVIEGIQNFKRRESSN